MKQKYSYNITHAAALSVPFSQGLPSGRKWVDLLLVMLLGEGTRDGSLARECFFCGKVSDYDAQIHLMQP